MRTFIAACAALAVATVIASSPVRADTTHYPGGPMTDGKMCWSSTNDLGYGYWVACPKPAMKMKMKKK